jgi:hypothetical protein
VTESPWRPVRGDRHEAGGDRDAAVGDPSDPPLGDGDLADDHGGGARGDHNDRDDGRGDHNRDDDERARADGAAASRSGDGHGDGGGDDRTGADDRARHDGSRAATGHDGGRGGPMPSEDEGPWPWVALALVLALAAAAVIGGLAWRRRRAGTASWSTAFAHLSRRCLVAMDDVLAEGSLVTGQVDALVAETRSIEASAPDDRSRAEAARLRAGLGDLAEALEADRALRLGTPPPSDEQLSYSTALIRRQVEQLRAVLRPPPES